MPNARAGCEAFPEQINATTGQHIEVVLNAGETITRLVDAEAFGSCNMTGATELIAAPAKGAHDAVYTFNKADTYYLTSAGMGGWSGPHCAGGLKVKVVVTGADKGSKVHEEGAKSSRLRERKRSEQAMKVSLPTSSSKS